VELRQALSDADDLVILWVMSSKQINERTYAFLNETGLRDRVRFLVDPDSALIERLGLLKPEPEEIEAGVPVPTTYLIDRAGVVRFADARRDYHVWLDPDILVERLASVD